MCNKLPLLVKIATRHIIMYHICMQNKSPRSARRGRGSKSSNSKGQRKNHYKPKQSHKKAQPKHSSRENHVGSIFTTAKGYGYVALEGFEEDIEIQQGSLNTALHNDLVEIVLLPRRKDERVQGEVVKVLERARKRFVGTLENNSGGMYLIVDDPKVYVDILIPKPQSEAVPGYKALVEIEEWRDSKKPPCGKVVEVLGPKGNHEVEMRSIIIAHNIDYSFPHEVLEEARGLKKKADQTSTEDILKEGRRDLRDRLTCTIDPVDAKDFDDALSVLKLPNGTFEIGIHIADVSHYVQPKTALDREARERGFSVYLVDRTIPMLPEVLSNDLCSLNPHEDKLAFSAVFTMNSNAEVISSWFGKTLIHSDKRYSYEDAQKTIDSGSGDLHDEIVVLNSLANILRKERFKGGAIDFAEEEVRFELDQDGVPLRVYKKARLDTHKLVEEFMLLANKEVAREIDRMNEKEEDHHIFVYRTHDLPNREKLEELGVFLRALGYEFRIEGDVNHKDINALLEAVRGKSHEALVNTALLRSMSKAHYSTGSKGHFGLAFDHYSHFTSPIRRYADLMVHRLLEEHLKGRTVSKKEWQFYDMTAKKVSQREIEVMQAERESIKYKQVEFMEKKVGHEFDALITGVSKFGVFVEEKETKASGLVSVRSMNDDFYTLDEKNYALVGEKTGKRFTLGDEIKVRLVSTDLDRKQINFDYVSK
jgi:ribonuclease R